MDETKRARPAIRPWVVLLLLFGSPRKTSFAFLRSVALTYKASLTPSSPSDAASRDAPPDEHLAPRTAATSLEEKPAAPRMSSIVE